MTTQKFKTVISKLETRTFIALPFNPNDVWCVNNVTILQGLLMDMVCAARLARMAHNIFSFWAQPGGVVVVWMPEQKWRWFYPRKVHNQKVCPQM